MPFRFRHFLLLMLVLFTLEGFSQKEAAIWHFGFRAGIDFNSGSPVQIPEGQTNTIEGVATISNKQGKLLFYTDGMTIWNRLNQVMSNGTGLKGHVSATQSGVIVPMIGDTSRYYVFSIDDYGNLTGLHYSIVNMNLDSGKGAVEVKNVFLINDVSEKLTAVKHCNQRDIWIITHSTSGNTYHAFLITPTGVNPVPVTSNTGSLLTGVQIGYLKASPDGKRLVAANWTMSLDISDFNNITGVVSNSYNLVQQYTDTSFRVYGIEFSPNGRLLYASAMYSFPIMMGSIPFQEKGDILLQYDIKRPTNDSIRASLRVIKKKPWKYNFAALQLAIDGRIYLAEVSVPYISSIPNPNTYGTGCGFIDTAVLLTGWPPTFSTNGLPNFIQSYFFERDSFQYTVECPGNQVSFVKKPSDVGNTFKWIFDDPSSGALNYSTSENPVHHYTSPGEHTVQLVTYTTCGSDTVRRKVNTLDLRVNLGEDTLMCEVNALELNAGGNGIYQYKWQDNSTAQTLLVQSPGSYSVEIKNAMGCTLKDSIEVAYDSKPSFSLGPDQLICPGNIIQLEPDIDPSWQLQWQDGTTTPAHDFTEAGSYSLLASNFCGATLDEVLINPGICQVFVPNAFTPNGDGKNDIFKILGTEKVTSLHLIIFNRWGEKVFETRDKEKGWDGKFHGKQVPTGTYIYMLQFTDAYSLEQQNLKGNFVLIR